MRTARAGVLLTWQCCPWASPASVADGGDRYSPGYSPRALSIQATLVSVDGETAEAYAEASEDSCDGRQVHTVCGRARPAGIGHRLGLYLRVAAVMIFCVEEDREREGDEPDSGDAFDRRWSDLLDAEADLLHEHAERLIATGSISVERPAGMVTARFRGPVWRYHGGAALHRRPRLDIEAIRADDSGGCASSHGPMVAKYRDRTNLINEIMLTLSLYLAWLDDK
jgi:hypothetical protein